MLPNNCISIYNMLPYGYKIIVGKIKKEEEDMPYIIILAIVIFLIFFLKREVPKNYIKAKKWVYKYRKQVIATVLIIGLIWFRKYTITFVVVCLIYYFYCKYMREKRVEEWEQRNIEPIEYKELDKNIEKVAELIAFNDKNKSDYKFTSSNMPYGRVNAFMNYFQRDLINEDIYYFSAIPSENENEVREYGFAITGSGIFIASQCDSKKGKTKELLFSGFNKAEYDADTDTLSVENIVRYGSGVKRTKVKGREITVPLTCIVNALTTLGQSNIPCALFTNQVMYRDVQKNLDEAEKHLNQELDMEHMKQNMGNVGTFASASERHDMYKEMKKEMNMRQGHGYGAEYGNKTVDRILGKKVEGGQEKENGHHKKSGADKIVNGQKVQTKYYKSAADTYRAGFKDSSHDYSGQVIEVPRDQYNEIKNRLQKDIDAGNMDGIEPGTPAENYLKKGYFSYSQSYRLAASGTIESITMDMANGIMTSMTSASITAIIIFASGVWQGKDVKEAAKDGLMTAGQVIGKGAVIYTITMQVSRGKVWNYALGKRVDSPMSKVSEEVAEKINSKIVNSSVGTKLNLQEVTGQKLVSGAVTVAVVFGPDVCRACMGKISVKQLAKNATAGAAGLAGMAVGSAVTAGNPLGGMIGGAVGGAVGKKVMDNFIEDDAVAMFRVMKEEFLDVVMSSYLTQEEFEEVAKRTIWDKKVSKELQNMYKKSKKGEHRAYANSLIEEVVIDVLKKRRKITNEMWIEGQQLMGA